MSLDLSLLQKLKPLANGGYKAQCPACRESGQDRTGNHLYIRPDGKFGCSNNQGCKIHRKRIWELCRGESPKEFKPHKAVAPEPTRDWPAILAQFRTRNLYRLAHELGVHSAALGALECGFATGKQLKAHGLSWGKDCWTFPMRNAAGVITGISLRPADGSKKVCFTGSSPAMFIPQQKPRSPLLICEGASDTAAAITLGYYCLGRYNCVSHVEMICDYVKRNGFTSVRIVHDNDDKHSEEGTHYNPGLDGAITLQIHLPCPSKLVTLPTKDLRVWLKNGGTRRQFDNLLNK